MRIFSLLSLFFLFSLNLSGQIYLMDGSPITTCNGFFMDSGGSSGNYGSNENFTTTICSDGSSGTHIRMNFSGVTIPGGDQLCFYDGVDVTAPQLSCHDAFTPGAPFIIQATAANTSGCLTITFISDGSGEGDGWSADLSCIPACQTILATFVSTDPIVVPADTGYIDICPGERVFFNSTGEYPQDGVIYNHSDFTSSFSWNFGDGFSAVGPNTSHVFTEPGGYVVELTIEDQFGCTNTNFISQRIRVSTYPDFEIAGDIPEEICAGDTISLDANVSNIDSTFEVSVTPTEGGFPTGGVRSDSLALPDGTGVTLETSIIFNNFSPGQVLTDINDLLGICVNMEHSWMHDLQIELVCPDGTSVVLQQQVFEGECFLGIPNEADEGFDPPLQGSGWNYCWTPTATNGNWTQYFQNQGVGTLPEGDYNAFGDLSDFLGCPLNGEWTIVVQDLWGVDNGWIFEWSIDFAPELYPDIETFTPQIVDWAWEDNSSIVFYSNDSITAALPNAGTPSYTFSVTDDFGCTYDTTVVVEVLPPTDPNCFSCQTLEISSSLVDSTICSGEMIPMDASLENPLEDQEITFEAFVSTDFDADVHPPGNPIASALDISYVNPMILTDPLTQIASVCVNIDHSAAQDIEIRLQAPNGVIIELSSDNGGNANDYIETCFTPIAINSITTGSPPFTGDWQPEGDWGDLIGSNTEGLWTLLVADDLNGFGGTFLDWSITFNSTNDVNYSWTNASTLSCSNCPDPMASPLATTEYIVTAVDAYGCSTVDTVTIDVLSAFPAPNLNCGSASGGDLTIDWAAVSGATNYEVSFDGGASWVPSNGLLSHTVSGLVDGNNIDILVRVVSNNGNCPPLEANLQCTYSEACAMSVDTSSVTPPSCWNTNDASVMMSVIGEQAPVSYSLDGGLGQGPNFTGIAPGTHTIVATDNIGCIDSITFTIVAPDAIVLNLSTNSMSCFGVCDGESTALATGGTGAFSYVWNTTPVNMTDNISNLCAGTYTVTATDANGCSAVETAIITEPLPIIIDAILTSNISCFGAMDGEITINLTGGNQPYTYLWDDPAAQTTNPAVGLSGGSYNVTITDATGCTTTANAGVTEPTDMITATVTQTFEGCNGAAQGSATVTAMGGDNNFTYLWTGGAVATTATNLSAGPNMVTVTDGNGCTVVETVQITELDPISVALSGTDPSCFGGVNGEVSVTSIIGGSGAGYTYAWSDSSPGNPTITGLAGGINYILTVTDGAGCTGTATYQMGQPAEIQVLLASIEPTCNGFVDGEATVSNVIGGNGNYTYLWDAAANNQVTATATALPVGMYSVTITDGNGCSADAQVEVEEPQTISLVFQETDNPCPGQNDGEITVNVIGGTPNYSYIWENGETTQRIDSLVSGGYLVTVTDANGCFVIDSAGVNGPPPLTADIQTDAVSCFGEDDGSIIVTLDGGAPPYQYSLDNIEFTGSNILIGLEGGTYNLFAVDVNGCKWNSSATVDSPNEFMVNAGNDIEIVLGDSIELIPTQTNATGFVDYTWIEPFLGTLNCENSDTLDCDTPFASPQSSISYELYGVDDNGCEDTDYVRIRVLKNRDIYVATGFTPNGDGNNDLLMVHGPYDNTVVNRFMVYDRWGSMVYDYDALKVTDDDPSNPFAEIIVNDPTFGWDGVFRGEMMNPGVYVWYVEVRYIDGAVASFKGNTTLIR